MANKVKFPLLEFCGKTLFEVLPTKDQLILCDAICARKTEGGNVILGIILQLRLPNKFEESIQKARAYIADADEWYVCDIIGERVWGVALLTQFEAMIETFEKVNAVYVMPASITLFGNSKADSKTLMLGAIKKHYPELENKYLKCFGVNLIYRGTKQIELQF